MKIEIDDATAAAIEGLMPPTGQPGPEALARYLLQAVADGRRRPGSWEAGMLEQLGIVEAVADDDADLLDRKSTRLNSSHYS